MNDIFKKWFPGKKKEESLTDTLEKKADIPPENLPLGIDDLFLAGSEVEKLQKDRKSAIEKHRIAVKDLELFHVAKEGSNDKRSKTYNQYLGHIEKEIEDIANRLTSARESFDLPQSRPEILKERLVRLEELKKNTEEKFAETELGKGYSQYLENLKSIDKKIGDVHLKIGHSPEANQEIKKLTNERIEAEKDFEYKIKRKKDFMDYARAVDRINRLITDTEWSLNQSLDDQYDENGQMRVR